MPGRTATAGRKEKGKKPARTVGKGVEPESTAFHAEPGAVVGSPTQRSLKLLRDRGYHAEVVEKWIPMARVRKDLWGWCDILCLIGSSTHTPEHDGATGYYTPPYILAVQTTTTPNMKARIQKIQDSDTIGLVRECGIAVAVHGWSKKKGRWVCRETDLS
jgi:hypothetical protein